MPPMTPAAIADEALALITVHAPAGLVAPMLVTRFVGRRRPMVTFMQTPDAPTTAEAARLIVAHEKPQAAAVAIVAVATAIPFDRSLWTEADQRAADGHPDGHPNRTEHLVVCAQTSRGPGLARYYRITPTAAGPTYHAEHAFAPVAHTFLPLYIASALRP